MQPKLETMKRVSEELKLAAVEVLFIRKQQADEWHALLEVFLPENLKSNLMGTKIQKQFPWQEMRNEENQWTTYN